MNKILSKLTILTYWQEEDCYECGDDVAAAVEARVAEGNAAPVLEMLVPAPAHDGSCSTDTTVQYSTAHDGSCSTDSSVYQYTSITECTNYCISIMY